MVEVREILIEQIKFNNKVLAGLANNSYKNIFGTMVNNYFSKPRTVEIEYQNETGKWIKDTFPTPYFYPEDEELLKSLMTCYLKDIITNQHKVYKDIKSLKFTCLIKGGKNEK